MALIIRLCDNCRREYRQWTSGHGRKYCCKKCARAGRERKLAEKRLRKAGAV